MLVYERRAGQATATATFVASKDWLLYPGATHSNRLSFGKCGNTG